MAQVYCGAKQPPKAKRVGNVNECKYKKQIRLFGLQKAGVSSVKLSTRGSGKVYCGAKKLPTGRRHGSVTECKSKRQLRKWGVFSANASTHKSLAKKRSVAAKVIQKVQKAKVLAKKRSVAAKRIQQLTRKRFQLRKKIAQEKSKKRSAATRIQKAERGRVVRKFEKQRKSLEKKIAEEEKKKKLAATKIVAMQKMRGQRKDYQKLMKRVNAAQFRRKTELNKFMNNPKQLTGKKLIIPSSMVSGDPKVISKAETGSGSVVFSVPLKWGIKKGRLNTPSGSVETGTTLAVKVNFEYLSRARHEKNIYDLVNSLVDDNVTPFVMKTVGNKRVIDFDDYHPSIQKEFGGLISPGEVLNTIPFITESACNGHIMSLGDIMDKNLCPAKEIPALLFQLYYTLECFNQIGLRHNDLHHNNILVVKRTGLPKNSYREFRFYDYRNDIDRRVLVPVTQYEIRIFDFDRSQKAKTPSSSHFMDLGFGRKDEWAINSPMRNKKLWKYYSNPIDDEKKFSDLWEDIHESMYQKHHNAQYDTFKSTICFGTWYNTNNNARKFLSKINDRKGKSILYTMNKLSNMANRMNLDQRMMVQYNFPVRKQPVMSGRHGVMRHDIYLDDYPTTIELLGYISDELHKTHHTNLLNNGRKLETYSIHNLYQ